MSEPTVSDQLFGQQPAASNDVASQLFGDSATTTSVADQLFGSADSVASQLFDDNNDIDIDDDTGEVEELESNELDPEDEDLADEQGSVVSQLFGQTASPSVEDQLFGASADFVEGGFEGPSPELVIAMLSGLLTPKPVSGAPSVNITFQGPVTFNL